jgi:transposase InsO family protein
MPWKAVNVPMLRYALIYSVREGGMPVAQAAREFGVCRDTAHKWLACFDRDPDGPLADRSSRPARSPGRTTHDLEALVLEVRDAYGWGARKIRAYLDQRHPGVPSVRTVHQILCRHRRVHDSPDPPASDPAAPVCFFERPNPNDLWQVDFKEKIEVARQRFEQLTVLDDHSRFLVGMPLCPDKSMTSAWAALWDLMGEHGVPAGVLADNSFGSNITLPKTLSWFDSRLVRLGVQPAHGRPYHPQTQGKVERLHGTLEAEFYPRARRGSVEEFQTDQRAWRTLYNHVRPHESVGDRPPATRYRPSPRRRPDVLPEITYPAGSTLRKVSTSGDVRWNRYRVLAGRGLVGEPVRIEETDRELRLYYGHVQIRAIDTDLLIEGPML